jgi:hypothetical protein
MKTAATWLVIASILGATAWVSATAGYRYGIAQVPMVSPPTPTPVQETWQYQSYYCGKNASEKLSDLKMSMVINAYGAQQFEPCAAPTGVFPTGANLSGLMWFRRQANPFTPSLREPIYTDQLTSKN